MGRKTSAALLLGTAALGISKGVGSSDLSSSLYELTTGNPNIDEEVFGTNVSARELFLPFPKIPFPGTRGFDFTRMGQIRQGGLMGLSASWDAGLVNGTMITDMNRENNRPISPQSSGAPRVDGSLVFGLKNSSLA